MVSVINILLFIIAVAVSVVYCVRWVDFVNNTKSLTNDFLVILYKRKLQGLWCACRWQYVNTSILGAVIIQLYKWSWLQSDMKLDVVCVIRCNIEQLPHAPDFFEIQYQQTGSFHSLVTRWWIEILGLVLLTLSWDKNWDSHSLVNGYPSFYPRVTLVAPSPGR